MFEHTNSHFNPYVGNLLVPLMKQVAEQQEWYAKWGPEAKRLCTATKAVTDKAKAKTSETKKKGKDTA